MINHQGHGLLPALRRVGAIAPEVIDLFDFLEDVPFWLKDKECRFQWVNIAFVLAFGAKSRAEVIGRTDYDFCGEVLANQYRMDDERVLRGDRIQSRMELVGRFAHTARWYATTKIPLHNAKGHIVGSAGFTRPLYQQNVDTVAGSPLSAAIRLISQQYAEGVDNEKLAKACGLSVRTFERQFRAAYQSSPHEYVRQLRVRMSCSALVFSRKSIAEVGSEFGFADQSHFTKEFKRVMGETPRAYRGRYLF
jgi:AraC-like DNA-binding protein